MTDMDPQTHAWTDADDERWLEEQERALPPLTPDEAFDALFEAWQDAVEDRHEQPR